MHELLDGGQYSEEELAANLREIRLVNRGLGWTSATLRLVERLLVVDARTSFSLLDVATGSGDLPRAVLRRARRRGWVTDVHALDASEAVLNVARSYLGGAVASRLTGEAWVVRHDGSVPNARHADSTVVTTSPSVRATVRSGDARTMRQTGDARITLHAGDARALPFPDRSFDLVTCSLSLHHFPPDEAASVLQEVARVARRAWVVVDVERGLLPYLGARWLRILLRNRLTRHDAPASVLRGYSLSELRALLARAGLPDARARRQFPFRLVAAGRQDDHVYEDALLAVSAVFPAALRTGST
jgi:SAM-dependent methyltransferase